MNRLDRIVLGRIGSRILLTVGIVFGLIMLVEALDTWRFQFLTEAVGIHAALLTVFVSAVLWCIKTLPVTVLLGATVGMLELQARNELTVLKTAGFSIWRVMRAPLLAVFALGLFVTFYAESAATAINRSYNYQARNEASARTPTGELWLEQLAGDKRYVLMAGSVSSGGGLGTEASYRIKDAVAYLFDWPEGDHIEAPEGNFTNGAWVFPTAKIFKVGATAVTVENYSLPTATTPFDLQLRLRPPATMTLTELWTALTGTISEPELLAALVNRTGRMLALPILLTGSLFIAFAFTAGYRRTNKYGASVIVAIILGFLVFVITEMADRAGSSGALDPVLAAAGPALVAIVIGATILLRKEDGRV
ncbi:MAG: LptF/LptG family permease [Devosia sp.]|nr:LptF/LptG family permease [Devosia sp.]